MAAKPAASRVALPLVKAWSFSRYSLYSQCPLKFKLQVLDKIKEPPSPAMERGAAIGKMAEDYIKGISSVRLPDELKAFAAEFRTLRKRYAKKEHDGVVVEDTWALKKDWSQTTWDDWNECWVRIKLDVGHHLDETTLEVVDWKTGKHRPDNVETYMEQLELYAVGAFLTYPHIEKVQVRLGFLDAALWHPAPGQEIIYLRKDVPRLKKLWLKRVMPMLNDRIFAPRPNRFCGWCWYRKSNTAARGGVELCKY